MSTPHNSAQKGDIAKTILLPGDPLRAKYIAETYLTDVKQFNRVRNMFGYTGSYQGREISVMGTGMGCASMGIYSYELIHFFGVRNLIRIGSCGGCKDKLNLGDLVIAMGSSSDTNYAAQYQLNGNYAATASYPLLAEAVKQSEKADIPYVVGNVLSTDIFYRPEGIDAWEKMGILAVEMESFALYCNAAAADVNALTMLTVSDLLNSDQAMTAKEREVGFQNMMEVALNTAWVSEEK